MNDLLNFEEERYFGNIQTIFQSLLCMEDKPTMKNKAEIQQFKTDETEMVRMTILNIENIIPHAQNSLTTFFTLNPNLRKNGYQYLSNRISEIRKLLNENEVSFKEERLSYLDITIEMIDNVFSAKDNERHNVIKLKFNTPKNVLFDFLKQLKNSYVQGKTPILSQSYKELAEFLISNVEGFEKYTVGNLSKEIPKIQIIQKDSLFIKVEPKRK